MKKRVGDFLVKNGFLTESQVEQILNYSVQTGLRFGDAAQELGLVTPEVLEKVFGPSQKADFYFLEAEHFPEETLTLINIDLILKCGALALGYTQAQSLFKKKKTLNVGFLNPLDETKVKTIEEALKASGAEFDKIKPFLILVEPYVEVLNSKYSVSEADLQKRDPSALDENLQMHLRISK